MIHLCYVSTAKYLMTQEELLKLLNVARQSNSKLGITGMLLYKDMSFLQVIEGEATTCIPSTQKSDKMHGTNR